MISTDKMKLAGKKLCCHFSLSEIESATQNFDEELVIGQGGFGKVYRGTFDDGSTAAIKRLDSGSKQGASEFRAEIEMLSRLRHCHLVSLTGYCDDENEMILVYELMPHGSLADHLHKLRTRLSWLQRLKICIGAARGLDYLHSGTGTHHGVIHRDIKSSNILLDDNWEAKISDFGLSKIGPTNQPSTSVSTAIKGTTGYLDPEYSLTGRLTRKSDVYSFGVVLLEVLCGRRAVDRSRDEEQWGLVGWAKDCIKEGNLLEIIDSTLSGQILLNCSSKFSQIALRCVHNRPKERPTMAEVVVYLEFALALQESLDYSEPDYAEPDYVSTPAKKISYIRKIQKFFFPSMSTYSGKTLQSVDHVVAGQKSNETHVSPPCLPSILEGPSSLIAGSDEDGNRYKLLPAIEGLQIIGEAFPGRELQACGYPINGTTICMFQWVRHMEHGSVNNIDGANLPTYVVTTDDVDTYLAVEVLPLDNWQREGKLIKCFANSNRKISCDPEMSRHPEGTLISSHTSVKIQGDANTEKQNLEEPLSLNPEPEESENELPAIVGLQIFGEAFPGRELQASGYSINGTTHCFFKWVRHMEDGSVNYIDRAEQPTYVVTSDDVDTYLAVEVQPLDEKQRKGELIKCFANSNRKISCDPEMSRHIERTLIAGQASYKLHLWTGSQDTWERATLEIKTEGFRIRNSRTNGVVATEKFSPATVVDIQYESPSEFSITGFGGILRLLKTESTTTDVSCSRDTIALTLRLFIKRAVEGKKGKKKRVLFFSTK